MHAHTESPSATESVAERIEHLPELKKKILAFHYQERMTDDEIGVIIRLPGTSICKIRRQAVRELLAGLAPAHLAHA